MTAMTAATLDTLSGGRFRLGLGVSGPQVSEGWHGVRFAKPLARTREYVDIVNLALSRERVRYDGATYQLPLPDGPGKALHLMLHPVREHIPIYLASIGPKNLELTGEIADGWLSVFFAPEVRRRAARRISAPDGPRSARRSTASTSSPTVPLVVGDDVDACADPVRPYAALYIGGMGSREQNFYNALAVRMGYADEAAEVQDLYLARDYDGAAAAVPPSSSTRPRCSARSDAHRRADGRVRRRRRHHAVDRAVRRDAGGASPLAATAAMDALQQSGAAS